MPVNRKATIRQITSNKVEFKNSDGRTIKGYIDRTKYADGCSPFVIISPGYAETKRDYISTSYYLAINGFSVLRYDCLNHLGESDGEIIDFTLLDMEDSMRAAINYLEGKFGATKLGLVASSLSGRAAFKVAPTEKRISYIISLTSVVDLKTTVSSVYKEDLITGYKKGNRWGVIDMLGFEVKDDFLKAAINNCYEDLDSTINDVGKIDAPVYYLVAGDDVWIKYDDVACVYKHTRNTKSKFVKIPNALHQIQENPRLAKLAILNIVEACCEYTDPNKNNRELLQPSIHDIVSQNKIEMQNLKRIFSVTDDDEKKFWVDYLSKFFIIIKSQDYQNLLSLIVQLLGGIDLDDIMLDAGCGNGHFGAWILYNMEKAIKRGHSLFSYTGLDFADDALSDAKRIHGDILKKIFSDEIGKVEDNFKHILMNLEDELPFPDDYFNKICCNLVISYLKDPVKVLKNLFSKLRPNGKIVVSSLKPYNDLSLIYKNYLDQNLTDEDILEGRKLLSSAGRIRHKEKQGHYHFFDEKELKDMLENAGFIDIKVYRAFGDQANIAVAQKG